MTQLNQLSAADLVGRYPRAKLIAAIESAQSETIESAQPETLESAQTPSTLNLNPTEEEIQANPEAKRSPWGGAPESQTAAGEEGTFLGDNVLFCHEAGKAYNSHSGEEVNLDSPKKSSKRRLINPQGKINKKIKALAEANFEAKYDRPDRSWVLHHDGQPLFALPSKQFSAYTPEELVAYATQYVQVEANFEGEEA